MGPYHAVIPGEYFIGNPTGNDDGMCEAGIGNAGSGEAFDVVLGDVFMVSQLVVFDLGNPNGVVDSKYPTHGQIGFAPKPATNITVKPANNSTLKPATNMKL
jgi:aspergillopepsin I